MLHTKSELIHTIKDLETVKADVCKFDPEQPHDFVDDTCNDVCLMIQDAQPELDPMSK